MECIILIFKNHAEREILMRVILSLMFMFFLAGCSSSDPVTANFAGGLQPGTNLVEVGLIFSP